MRRISAYRSLGILCLFLTLALTGCGKDLVLDKVNHRVEAALPGLIGPAKAYHARSNASIGNLMDGRLRSLHIEGEEVAITPDLTVDLLKVDMEGVQFDTSKNELKEVKSTQAEAQLKEESIQRYLQKARPQLENIKVKVLENEIQIQAKPKILGLTAPMISATGKLELNGATKLNFVPTEIRFGSIASPKSMTDILTKGFNPVMDLAKFNYPIQLSEIELHPGVVVVRGTADFKHKDSSSK